MNEYLVCVLRGLIYFAMCTDGTLNLLWGCCSTVRGDDKAGQSNQPRVSRGILPVQARLHNAIMISWLVEVSMSILIVNLTPLFFFFFFSFFFFFPFSFPFLLILSF